MICIFSAIKRSLDVFLKTRIDSELERKDIGKAKNVGFRVYDQGMVTYEQDKLGYLGRWYSYKAIGFLNYPSKMFS